MPQPVIYVSGLAQGTDPAGGCAVARCLRDAYPESRIIGVDYSVRAAGLHDPVFDDVEIHRPWGEFDTESLRAFVSKVWESGAYYLPTIDLEAYWLARQSPGHPLLLSPPAQIYSRIAKPIKEYPHLFGLSVPDSVMVSSGDIACHAFLRRHGFKAWMKAPFHDSSILRSWEGFAPSRDRHRVNWPFDGLHLQAHVEGSHETVAFCALEGRLLEAVWIVKNDMSAEGKVIGGTRLAIQKEDRLALATFVEATNWTGGGEVELVRAADNQLWLIEINPRFPAWIAGPVTFGCNLPATLLDAATGNQSVRSGRGEGFVRLQIEVPVREGYDLLPPLVLTPGEPLDAGKTAFNIRELAEHVEQSVGLPIPEAELPRAKPVAIKKEPGFPTAGSGATPAWIFSGVQLEARCEEICSVLSDQPSDVPILKIAYSMKTNPDPRLLRIVKDAGFAVEVISAEELERAIAAGFPINRVVLNGPAKSNLTTRTVADGSGLAFVDSLEELQALLSTGTPPRLVGVRIRPPRTNSRFGIPIEEYEIYDRLLGLLAKLPAATGIGLHVHIPHALMGSHKWRSIVREILEIGTVLEAETGKHVIVLDLGGGFYPDDLMAELNWIGCDGGREFRASLPRLARVIVEPGRAIAQDCFAVETTVLEIRTVAGQIIAVVDAALAEVSEAGHYPHRLYRWSGSGWIELTSLADDKIYGRTCMEADVLFSSLSLAGIKVGDRLLIGDTGSYDRSMAYEFGRGRSLQASGEDRNRSGRPVLFGD